MVYTYRNISTKFYIFGVRLIEGVVVMVISVILLATISALLGIICFLVGYYYARKHRETKMEYTDIFNYLSLPSRFSLHKELK